MHGEPKAFGQTDPLGRADVAAAEDGRTPLNTCPARCREHAKQILSSPHALVMAAATRSVPLGGSSFSTEFKGPPASFAPVTRKPRFASMLANSPSRRHPCRRRPESFLSSSPASRVTRTELLSAETPPVRVGKSPLCIVRESPLFGIGDSPTTHLDESPHALNVWKWLGTCNSHSFCGHCRDSKPLPEIVQPQRSSAAGAAWISGSEPLCMDWTGRTRESERANTMQLQCDYHSRRSVYENSRL